MGVPSFYRWLVKKYPKIVSDANSEGNANSLEFDNLYLDMNGIIHPCFHPEDNLFPPTTFEEVFSNIYDYIDMLFNIVRPRKLLYMAIDGVAPRAKMNQQRRRRFRTAKDDEVAEEVENMFRKQFELEGKKVLPKEESELSDSNIITPGTEFMYTLSKKLQSYVKRQMTNDCRWNKIKVILSDANVPGEGEHKIMSFIRAQRSCEGYDPNTRHCLHGLDADLIMLALATHEVHFSILREEVLVQEERVNSVSELERSAHKAESYSGKCRGWFKQIVQSPESGPEPGSCHTEVASELVRLDGHNEDKKKVNARAPITKKPFQYLHVWLLREYLYIEMNISDPPENVKVDLERIIDDFIFICFFSGNDFLPHMPSLEIHEVLSNTRELKQKLKDYIRNQSDTFRNGGLFSDKVKLGVQGWKKRYYEVKFSAKNPEEMERVRKLLVEKYTEGLFWVLKYYFSGVPSWTWFYPYHYGPFASDFKGLARVNLKFQKGLPLKPFDQLLAVLPPKSAHALPEAYKKLMVDEDSSILDFYPTTFQIDADGKRFMWQGICKVRFIQEDRLLAETRKAEKELKDHERERNAEAADRLFIWRSSGLGEQISSVYKSCPSLTRNDTIKINDTLSDGMSGFMHLFEEKDIQDVFCVFYKLPLVNNPKHHLAQGVKIPDKIITEADIVETTLWHESNSSTFRRVLANQNHVQKSSPKNQEPQIIYIGTGTGWAGRGRAKFDNYSRQTERGPAIKSYAHWAGKSFSPSSSTSTSASSLNSRLEKQLNIAASDDGCSRLQNTDNGYWENRSTRNASPAWRQGNPISPGSPWQQVHGRGQYAQNMDNGLWENRSTRNASPAWRQGNPISPGSPGQQVHGRGQYVQNMDNGSWENRSTRNASPARRQGNPISPGSPGQQVHGRGQYVPRTSTSSWNTRSRYGSNKQ